MHIFCEPYLNDKIRKKCNNCCAICFQEFPCSYLFDVTRFFGMVRKFNVFWYVLTELECPPDCIFWSGSYRIISIPSPPIYPVVSPEYEGLQMR